MTIDKSNMRIWLFVAGDNVNVKGFQNRSTIFLDIFSVTKHDDDCTQNQCQPERYTCIGSFCETPILGREIIIIISPKIIIKQHHHYLDDNH